MIYLKYFKESFVESNINTKIKNLKKLPNELKEVSISLSNSLTSAENGKVFGLSLHKDLLKKIKDGNYPSGFSMGVDKNGYFIHTHRARSKSFKSPSSISVKSIKFIDSTG